MTHDDDDPRHELRQVRSRLAALRAWAAHHPESGFVHPDIKHLEARARVLTATTLEQENTPHMPNPQIVRDRLAEIDSELRSLHTAAGDRPLTRSQQSRWDDLTAQADEATRNLALLDEEDAKARRVAESRARWGSIQVGGAGSHSTNPDDALRMDANQARDTALRMLDRDAGHLTDNQREHIDHLVRGENTPSLDVNALNRHIVLTSGEDYRAAFRKITGPSMSSIVTLPEREASAVIAVNRASMAEGSGATGGYAVPAFLDPTIALNAQGSANPIRKIARNETITTSQWKGVGTTGVSWSFVAEGQPSTDASPTVSQPTVDMHTARAWITYSLELQQDAIELDRQLFRLLGNGWDDTVAGVLATGSGSGAPKGIITALDAIPASEVSITAAGSLAAADISKVWVSLPDRARENASWVMNESVRETIAGWGDEYGKRSVDMGGRLKTLRERPVYSSEKFPAIATTTASANQMVVGDFSGYLIVQRAGMTVEPVQTVFDGSGFPTGKRGLFAWARIGADLVDADLLRLLKQ
ncbi:MAG: phage major capsid protein [Micropruina sp.]